MGRTSAPDGCLRFCMGFSSGDRLPVEARTLRDRIDAGEALQPDDARRVLLAVEIVFASDVVGSSQDWRHTTGLSDEESIGLLRGIQRKAGRARYQSAAWRPRPA